MSETLDPPEPGSGPAHRRGGIELLAGRKRVVVVGGGFGGIAAARGLAGCDVDVVLVDRRNHHLFQPLLYQVATAVLAPADVSMPIRGMLRKQRNARVLLGEVKHVEVEERRVHLEGPWGTDTLEYDWLVLAAGATHSYFGNPQWAVRAPGLKTLDDALEIRRRVFLAYERAEWLKDPVERRRELTFVVVGAGPTGVELAGALAEISRLTLAEDFRNIDPTQARVLLLEGTDTVLRGYPDSLRQSAQRQLESLGVQVRFGAMVAEVDDEGVVLAPPQDEAADDAEGTEGEGTEGERIEAATVIWAAGVAASELGEQLPVDRDRAGRVKVSEDLSLPGHPEVFVIGDMAHSPGPEGEPLPGVAQVAIQGGTHVGRCVRADLSGGSRKPFRYRDLGSMATIGRSKAICWVAGLKLTGFVAWLMWLFVHLMALVGYRNRFIVLAEWAWSYVTWQRGSRLIRTTADTPADQVLPG